MQPFHVWNICRALPALNITHIPSGHCYQQLTFSFGVLPFGGYFHQLAALGTLLVMPWLETWHFMLATLTNPTFWDKKIRIAILTLATFIALC
jgi:hypothetical protein